MGGFGRSESGASAVEFAMLAVPFFGILCATFETAVDYWAQTNLDVVLSEAARGIYTGKFQSDNAGSKKTPEQMLAILRDQLCNEDGKPRSTLFVCQNVRLNITSADTFTGSSSTSPVATDAKTGKTDWNSNFGKYTCATGSTIVRVQAAVDFPVYFSFLKPNVTKLSSGRRILESATVFRVEPYQKTGVCS